MNLIRLKANNFRNLIDLNLEFSPQLNFIYGVNGSGKSSILEAIYFLSLGRSFRSHLSNRIIHYDATEFTIFGSLLSPTPISIGLEKSRAGKTRIKVGNDEVASIAELAKILPVQLINPDSYQLLNAGPKERRQFLNWGTFHVEPSFFPLWQRFQRVLKQRNVAIQSRSSINQIKIWDIELVSSSLELDSLRKNYVQQLTPLVSKLLEDLIELKGLTIDYQPGWDEELGLKESLDKAIHRDLALGYTQYGPHRADVTIKINNIPAGDVLSRGEQKLLVCALQLAQGLLLKQLINKRCVYLLDDLAAELDKDRQERIATVLRQLEAQVFLTAVDINALQGLADKSDMKMFHVKQGMVG